MTSQTISANTRAFYNERNLKPRPQQAPVSTIPLITSPFCYIEMKINEFGNFSLDFSAPETVFEYLGETVCKPVFNFRG